MSNSRLLKYAITAYGLNPDITSNTTIRAVLTSDLSDPNSLANTLTNSGYKALASAFNFNTDGSVNGTAQSVTTSPPQFISTTTPPAPVRPQRRRHTKPNITRRPFQA
jgi:Protein of unknown function (DUF1217)